MVNESGICFFYRQSGYCSALDIDRCDGLNPYCTFYKTEKQFTEERDRAVKVCREKNLCIACKYVGKPCMTSTDLEDMKI